MIPETENPQEAKSVYPGKPVRHAYADPGRYFTQSPQCWFSPRTTMFSTLFNNYVIFKEIFQVFVTLFSKSSATYVVCGKGLSM